ncbi:uncharacterized protein abca12 isoform X4 [Pleuronectes platessa]|uniref:uncharacterized protein abca12 isoform X4 n=1 Tax=Pleuronectes platessa TaxID=8262 RepID=UPI00232A27D2|nr:uncharacterized protein abca12 isoform X4 [Pleuronectes platessa]
MAFLQQLRLLLWKNGLTVIRQPLWSLTLIIWPLIIFIIIAVTRNQFPPVVKETCYVGPRNLPSTGFFPFLQTLMCNTDSNCHDKSQLAESAASKSKSTAGRSGSSSLPNGSPLAGLMQGDGFLGFTFPKIDKFNDPASLINAFQSIVGQTQQGSPNNVSFTNTTLVGDKESFNKLLESVSVLKRAICTMILPMINTTSPDPLTTSAVTFCKTNNTVLEVSLSTLNQVLSDLMQNQPDEMMTVAGLGVMVFDQLQNQTSLWESLLVLPQLFSNGSVDQGLHNTEVLLTNIQGALHVIQKNFPEASPTLSSANLVIAGGINVIRYIQNWPGKVVSISLGDVVTLQNDSISEMLKRVLQEVKIPLDQAIGLTMDRRMVASYLCDNGSNPIWLTAACSTGTVDMLLRRISPDKVAKQVLLAWSKHVAPHDVAFVKGLLHSLIGGLSPGGPGGSNTTRNRRSVETQPQNIDEDLFLSVGQVVMELVKLVPELEMVVQSFLNTGFQSLMTGTLALDTVEEMMENILKDANQFKVNLTTLLTNQPQSSVWIGRVLGSVAEVVMRTLASDNLTCADVLGPLEFLLETETIKIDVWRAIICQNSSDLPLYLLKDWQPLIQKAQEVYDAITSRTEYNVTLPMILSEWQKSNNKTMKFGELLNRLAEELGGAYWMNWMPDNPQNFTQALQQSVFFFMVNLGEKIEKSELWPEAKNYFHMVYWVLNYNPGVTPPPSNCSVNIYTLAINCDTGLNWSRFVQGLAEPLMSSDVDVLVRYLKGTLNLLQHMYGDIYKYLATSSLKKEIKGGDALSNYLVNLMLNLDAFLRVVSTLPNSSTSNPNVLLPQLNILLTSTGLAPLLPLFLSDGPLNFSAVIDVASKVGRLNQHIFTFNETDPTMPELEGLITKFLSLQGDLTLSLPHIMGSSLLTYSDYFDPDVVARIRKAIKPFTNQTSSGIVETILSAMEVLKTVIDSPNGDPTNVILGYLHQLQELVMSIYRLRKIEHIFLPSSQVSAAQITDLHVLSKDFLNLLTPESLQNLTQAGPDAAQNIVIQKFVAFLPPAFRQEVTRFLQDFKALQYYIIKCGAGQDCLAGISEILNFLDQILDLMLSAEGTVTIKLAATNASLVAQEYEELTSFVFSLLLGTNDSANVKTVKQALHLIRMLVATPNISVSDVQNALRQSNLTLKELNSFAALAGAADINRLLLSIMEIINTRQCFEPDQDLMVTAQCVTGLVKGLSDFLTRVPGLRNQTAILSLIPLIVNSTFRDIMRANFSYNPNVALEQTLNGTLANIKLILKENHLNSPEIMNEIKVVERLIQLIANMEPYNNLNTTLMMDPMYAQKVYSEIIDWYLKKLGNITTNSTVSEILQPFFVMTQMQVTLQLAQTDFSLSVTKQIENLIKTLQFPIDGAGLNKIGQTTVEILKGLFDIIKFNLEAQNNMMGPEGYFNSTVFNAITAQITHYLNVTEEWLKQPNVQLIFTSMLQWGNSSINTSTPVTDIQQLLQTASIFLNEGEVIYLSAVLNTMRSLEKALMVTEQPGGLQSDHFVDAIVEGVKTTITLLTGATGPLPHSVQQDILDIVQASLKLILLPDKNFDSSRNISLLILERAESVIETIIPEMYAVYIIPVIEVIETFFESASGDSGPDIWNHMILSELETIESLLPPNSTARTSISVVISIARFILESGQGKMSLWARFDRASLQDVPMLIVEILKGLFDIIKFIGAEDQKNMMVPEEYFNSTVFNAITAQIPLYLNITEEWLKQPNVQLIFTSMLQWGNSSINTSTPVTDIQHLLQTMSIFLNKDEVISLSAIINTVRSLEKALMVAERPGGLQSDHFIAAIVEGVKTTITLLTGATGPLPHSVQQDILNIVQASLKLIVQPDKNFDSSRNISLLILERAESVVKTIIPEMYAVYIIAGIEVVETFFESASGDSGPDIWNHMILSELKTIESLLPPNSTARTSISVVINIARFILESGQGNMSLWARFERASLQEVPMLLVEILKGLFDIIKFIGAEDQKNMMVPEDYFNSTVFNAITAQIPHYLNITEEWLKQPNVQLIFTSMLQWGNSSINTSTPVTDIQHLLQTMSIFLNEGEGISLSAILNTVRSLEKALMVAERPGGLQSDHFVDAIVEGVKTTITLLIGATGPLPHSVQQDILDIVQASLKLIVQPDKNFDSSRNISLLILERAESIVETIIPEMYAVYIIPVIEVIETFFESASGDSGPDIWNHMILSELKTIESLLPPNSTARTSISVVISIARFILESGQGNMSLWELFERASLQDVPMLIGQLGRLVSSFFMGMPDVQQSIGSSMGIFTHLSPFLEQLMSGKADQHMWDNLEKMLLSLLSSLEGTELWHDVSSVVPLFENMLGSLLNNMQAQNVMLLSLQTPVVTLMREVARSVNTSHFNLTEVTERIQAAVEHTVQAAQQANGTLGCREALRPWEPVREAAGLSPAFMAMWCNISLQPVIEAYAAALTPYSHINMTHMGVGPTAVNASAARIAETMQALYHVIVNQSLVTEQLISAFSEQLGMLAGRPLSPEAQLHWNMQLQDVQLQNSLSSIKMLTDELRRAAPSLQPYVEAAEKAIRYFIINSPLLPNSSSSQDLLKQTAMIFLTSANITAGDIFSAMSLNVSGLNEASIINAMREVVKLMAELKILGDDPKVYRGLEQMLGFKETTLIVRKVVELITWLGSTRASGVDLLMEVVHRLYDIFRSVLSLLSKLCVQMPENSELFVDLGGNIIGMLKQLLSTPGLLSPMHQQLGMSRPHMAGANHSMRVRHKREAAMMPMMMRDPMDDFIDLFYIDYHSMSEALNVPPTTGEILETVHMFFNNPDLGVVLKGATRDMPWGMNASREETIDASLVGLSVLTLPSVLQMPMENLLMSAVAMLTDAIPFPPAFKNITRALANESQEILMLMQQAIQTAADLFQSNMTDQQLKEKLTLLTSQVCALENTETMHQLLRLLSIEPGQLCRTILPSLQLLAESLLIDASTLTDAVFQSFIGEPKTYNISSDWTDVLGQGLGFNTSSLHSLNINVTAPGVVTVGELLRDEAAFVQDVQRHMDFDPAALHLLMGAVVPNNNMEILSWLVNLRQCNSTSSVNMKASDAAILKTFCSMSVEQWYSFSLLMVRHLNMEKLLYRVVLSEEMQSLVVVMLQMAETLTDMMNNILPMINTLQSYLFSIQDLNLMANNEFSLMSRGQKSSISTKATFVTLSRALCSNGIMALFGIAKLPPMPDPTFPSGQWKEEMIDRFKIPRNATPFCMNMYLDMVNTTGGAIAWAFLKPMLMGKILFTPDTPITRDIMEKANATLQEFANLRKNSQDWIQSSNYIVNSAEMLSNTLPMLQSSLSNSFVKNFIEMQTDIDVGKMKETLSGFSNMSVMLEKNKQILNQITTLSTLMVDLSSCIKFDRYRGYDSAEKLNHEAQELAKDRNLYASVIFKLPKDDGSTKSRHARSSSNTSSGSSLPPQVSYTIRMHMDNVMRTDRVREPFFVKDPHILARQTLRYNRGFVYLQENIDRAIIESQTGKKVSEPAVQLQPFPYPCHLRDEYLEAISFVFPIMLMLAWVLFIADFVKKLVHERELRLHEYMKMMGVNPLSHFFAWFLECAAYLGVTIIILTLVLKYGKILPNSDGFLLFLYLCDYGLSIIAFSFLVSSFFDKTYIAGLSGSLLYILCFFPFIVVMAVETNLNFSQKSALSLFSPTCFSYASQYVSRYEAQGEGIQWSNAYTSPIAGDSASFGWLCWLMLIDSILYFIIGAYIRKVFPGNYGIPCPWYFPFKASFWADLCCCIKSKAQPRTGLILHNIMQSNQHDVFSNDKEKGKSSLSFRAGEDFSERPVGVALHSLSKMYGDRVAIQNLNVSFHEGHVTSLLGHNGAGKTTTMSLLTGLFAPTSGTIEVYGRDMQSNIDDIRKELGVCMQYDVLFDHMTTKEHLLLYGQIKAPHWSKGELHEQVRSTLEETGMYAHRHKRVGTLSGGMKRKLSISIAFIGGSRLVVLDEPTTGVDPCSRRSIWDIVIQHKKNRTIIMSTHHLDEAEVLSDRIAFLERGGLKCCGSPLTLKDKLGQGYKLTLTKKLQNLESEVIDSAELKHFIQAHVPEARLKEAQGGDLVYSLPPFTSANASSYRSLLTALDSNLDALQLGGYGISDTTLEEVFLQLTRDNADAESVPLSISESISDSGSVDSFPSDNGESLGDKIKLTGSSTLSGMALAWQQMSAILIKRFHHSRRDWKGLIAQILLPVLFVVFAMGLGSIRSDLQHYPELELSPALYNIGPSYSFFRNQNPSSGNLVDSMMSFPGMDNACLDGQGRPVCARNEHKWSSRGNSSKGFSVCKCTTQEQVCDEDNYNPPHEQILSSQVVYNLSGINVENYLVATANDFIRNRYGGFDFGMQLPTDLQMDLRAVPKNRTLSKVWFNPEGHHTMPAYLNSLNNLILRSNLPKDKDPRKYAISVSSHPYFGRADDEDAIVQGMLQILVAMCVLCGYSIMTASFAIYEVHEHHSGSKRLQHIAGISEPFYWVVNFLYDMVIYMIPVTLTVGVVAAFQVPAFTDRQNLGAVTLLLVLFGFATFPWMYLLSGVFKDAEMAFITYVCINLFISVNTIMSTSILYFLGQLSMLNPELVQTIYERLSYAFYIFPQFNFGNGLMYLARKNIEVQILSGYGIDAYHNPFSTDALGWMLISSFIQGVVFFTLRLLLNQFLLRKVRHLICGRKTVPQVAWEDEDEDVAAENLRVSSGAANTDLLQVDQLTKIYQHFKRKVPAVKRLSVGIPAGECFGLLGVNGAGKTTTFKMLTGDVSPSDGTAQIRDLDGRLTDIMECRSKGINIGYCPQEDALDSLLTGEEHLDFYARLRGIPKRDREGVVNYLLKRLELSYHRNIITDSYSCGTRRKLSTALALIGHPQILLLDEPSSGMDPRTKRHLWKIISEEVRGKCAVVLTSHSMEECEALCSRLAIMDKGQFRCLGSLQHIKNRFGSGFTVRMYMAKASCDAEAITGFMQRRFPSTYLKDLHSTMVEYHVPVAPGGVADIFDQLESNKNALQIKHFSVSQTTLDEVFINFAMGKIGMETLPIHSEEEEWDDLESKKAEDA